MNLKPFLGLSILAGTAALATEPAPEQRADAAAGVAAPAADVAAPTGVRKYPPLDLRVRDIREYLTPEEFRALLNAREEERNTVVVKADAPLLPMKSGLDIPGGILTPFWALANPHKIWRLVLPDPRIDITRIPPPESPVPPREFRWGP